MKNKGTSLFRNDISFFRAIAILMVVFYHLKVPGFKHGYVGVDIFFLLSGYLMCQSLSSKALLTGKEIALFYWNRFTRLIPAFSVFILLSWVIIWLLIGVKLYDFSKNALISQVFLSNIYYYLSINYFSSSSELNFLIHTWSLSVEWQFYIFFPLVIYLQHRFLNNKFRFNQLLLIFLLLLSLVLFLLISRIDQPFAFYLPFCRLWEFLLGALVYSQRDLFHKLSDKIAFRIANFALFLFFLLFPLSNFYLLSDWSPLLIMVVLLLVSVILLLQLNNRFVSFPAIHFIARISYSWYLWHWFIIVIFNYFFPNQNWMHQITVLIISAGIAYLSYACIEFQPYLRKKYSLICLFFITILLTGFNTKKEIVQWVIGQKRRDFFDFYFEYPRTIMPFKEQFGKNHLLSRNDLSSFDFNSLNKFQEGKKNYLLIGDCHAGMFYYSLKELADMHQVNLIQVTADDVFPVKGVNTIFEGSERLMHYVFDEYIPKFFDRIDQVILVADYSGYSKKELTNFLECNNTYFKEFELPHIYIGQTSKYKVEYPVLMSMVKDYRLDTEDYLLINKQKIDDFMLKELGDTKYIQLDHLDNFSNDDNNYKMMYDAVHLSTVGTAYYSRKLEDYLFRN